MLPRERAFLLLDRTASNRCTWVTAPAGAGKTMLAASWVESRQIDCLWLTLDAGDTDPATLFHYLQLAAPRRAGQEQPQWPTLTPEFLPGLDVFARRFFEQLLSLYDAPFVVVLDNCHEVPEVALLFSPILGALFDSLPAHAQLLLLSRSPMPGALARWRIHPAFRELGADDLRFTDQEAIELAARVAPALLAVALQCNQWAKGWAAGLKLLLSAAPGAVGAIQAAPDYRQPLQTLFDYFAQEVLQRSPQPQVLLVGSVLTEMDAETLAALTGDAGAGGLLERLYEERLFIERRSLPAGFSYQLHPLFREFLRAGLMRQIGVEALRALKSQAARVLQARGQQEAATLLALEGDDPTLLTQLIRAQAPLLMAQGRLGTLEQWLQCVPESVRRRDAWLQYWLGVTCAVRDPVWARAHLERVYQQFRDTDEPLGAWLTAAMQISIHFASWGSAPEELERWIREFEGLRAQNGGSIPQSIEVPVIAQFYNLVGFHPEHPLSRYLIERSRVLAPTLSDSGPRYGLGALAIGPLVWQGDEAAAWILIRQLQLPADNAATSLGIIAFEIWHGVLLWIGSNHRRSFEVLSAARERGRNSGLTILDWNCTSLLVLCCLSAGEVARADQLLQEAIASLSAAQINALQLSKAVQALVHGLMGRATAAAALARETLDDRRLIQAPSSAALERTLLAAALLEAGALEETCRCAAEARELASLLPSDRWRFDAQMLWAAAELARGDESAALDLLRRALAVAARRDFGGGVSLFNAARATRLLGLALRHGIETTYVQRLIRQRRLATPPEIDLALLWPVRLRIRALGGFSITLDGQPLQRAQRLARKPLEVLQALIGLGPSEVTLQALGAALWPELDGDGAHNACHVALHRLRRVLGDDEVIRVEHGLVVLDASDTWIDVESFRQLIGRLRAAMASPISSRALAERWTAELVSSYPGHFLPAEQRAWAAGVREQLRSRFVRATTALSATLERLGAMEAAVELYRHAIDLDPHSESFHRGLMRAHLAMGHKADALEAFERCRRQLAAGLSVEPSPETLWLHRHIRDT
jgi:ATP/maltotriose-dependent transcriptional regulator MalT/DNA-binding SARP family transcriptional activator